MIFKCVNICTLLFFLSSLCCAASSKHKVLSTKEDVVEEMHRLIQFPEEALYSGVYGEFSFTLHFMNGEFFRVSFEDDCYWAFKEAVEDAVSKLSECNFAVEPKEGYNCVAIHMTHRFEPFIKPLSLDIMRYIDQYIPATYGGVSPDNSYSGLKFDILSKVECDKLKRKGIDEIFIEVDVQADGSPSLPRIYTLNGVKIDSLDTNPFKKEFSPMVVNGKPCPSVYREYSWVGSPIMGRGDNQVLSHTCEEDDDMYLEFDSILYGESPKFQGGDIRKFEDWVVKHIRYPKGCIRERIEGNVRVHFTIKKDGSLSNIELHSSPDYRLTIEAFRLIESSPRWDLSTYKGKIFERDKYATIKFRLPN